MLESTLLSGYAFWLLLGLLLLASEFFIPGLIAMFFGIAALIVGLLTLFGVIGSLSVQLMLFALISLATLFGLRRHFRRWLRGGVSEIPVADLDDSGLVGMRVMVISDFDHGVGHVQLNGSKWDAESTDPLKSGDAAWVVSHRGIVLRISATPSAS